MLPPEVSVVAARRDVVTAVAATLAPGSVLGVPLASPVFLPAGMLLPAALPPAALSMPRARVTLAAHLRGVCPRRRAAAPPSVGRRRRGTLEMAAPFRPARRRLLLRRASPTLLLLRRRRRRRASPTLLSLRLRRRRLAPVTFSVALSVTRSVALSVTRSVALSVTRSAALSATRSVALSATRSVALSATRSVALSAIVIRAGGSRRADHHQYSDQRFLESVHALTVRRARGYCTPSRIPSAPTSGACASAEPYWARNRPSRARQVGTSHRVCCHSAPRLYAVFPLTSSNANALPATSTA